MNLSKALKKSIYVLLFFVFSFSGVAQEGVTQQQTLNNKKHNDIATINLRSTIQGNQEQPKVMYIVPWQTVDAPPASYKPLDTMIQENFNYIDRDEFRRLINTKRN